MLGFYALSSASISGLAGVMFNASVSESFAASDTGQPRLAITSSSSDTSTTSDSLAVGFLFYTADSITTTDSLAVGFLFYTADSITTTDSVATNLAAVITSLDYSAINDKSITTAVMLNAVSELLYTIDVGAGYGGWDLIAGASNSWSAISGVVNNWSQVPGGTGTWTTIKQGQ